MSLVPQKENDLEILRNYTFQEPENWGNQRFNLTHPEYNWRLPGYNRRSNEILLGVKEGKLVNVKSTDVNCWNLFLRCFGFGVLSKTHISMKNIVSHLEKHEWKNLENDDKALLNIRKIATNTLYLPKDSFAKNSVPSEFVKKNLVLTKTKHGDFYLSETTTARDFSKQIYEEALIGRKYYGILYRSHLENNNEQVPPNELLNSAEKIDNIVLKLYPSLSLLLRISPGRSENIYHTGEIQRNLNKK